MTLVVRWAVVAALSVSVLTVPLAPASAQEGEKKVTIDQVPVPVKKAILEAVGDGKLVDIGEFAETKKTRLRPGNSKAA
jgi:hypothetical protein